MVPGSIPLNSFSKYMQAQGNEKSFHMEKPLEFYIKLVHNNPSQPLAERVYE